MGEKANKKANIRIVFVFLMFAFVLFCLSGCGASLPGRFSADDGYKKESLRDTVGQSGNVMYDSSAPPVKAGEESRLDRKIIQDVRINLKVNNLVDAMDKIASISTDGGGYVVYSHMYRDEEWDRGEINIKVPADKLNQAMDAIEALGEVSYKNTSTQDVTEEYYDSQARLAVLKKKEERLLALMDTAKSIEDIIKVENELTRARSDIEVLEGRLKYLTNMTNYSSIYISLQKAALGALSVPSGTFGKAGHAFVNSINGVIGFLSGFFVWFIGFIPWGVLLGVIACILYYIKRKTNWSPKWRRVKPEKQE